MSKGTELLGKSVHLRVSLSFIISNMNPNAYLTSLSYFDKDEHYPVVVPRTHGCSMILLVCL